MPEVFSWLRIKGKFVRQVYWLSGILYIPVSLVTYTSNHMSFQLSSNACSQTNVCFFISECLGSGLENSELCWAFIASIQSTNKTHASHICQEKTTIPSSDILLFFALLMHEGMSYHLFSSVYCISFLHVPALACSSEDLLR